MGACVSLSIKVNVIERKAYELIAASILGYMFLDDWTLGDNIVKLPISIEAERGSIITFKTSTSIPVDEFEWLLKVKVEGSGILRVNGTPYYGLDYLHTTVPLPRGDLELSVDLTPVAITGALDKVGFDYALVSKVYWRGFKLGLQLLGVYDYILNLGEDELRRELVEGIGGLLVPHRIPISLDQMVLAYMIIHDYKFIPGTPAPGMLRPRFDIYVIASTRRIPRVKGFKYVNSINVGELADLVAGIEDELVRFLEDVKGRRGSVGYIIPIGHSHIDVAWLWTRDEARFKTVKTIATMIRLLELYNDSTMSLSSSQILKWVEDEGLLGIIKNYADMGRFELLGGMWVEGDLNIVDGESLARQLLYGQRYLVEKLGRKALIAWLPDNFGYSANLPQILLDAGLRMLFIQKLHWNDTSKPRNHFFKWRGLDGSIIPVQLIPQYDNPGTPRWVYSYTRIYDSWSVFPYLPLVYGFGDGGGGPNIAVMEMQKLVDHLPGLPRVSRVNLRELADIAWRTEAPVVEGELYLELHRGIYTTNARIKELIARAESLLRSSEIALIIGELLGLGEARNLRDLWVKLLINQFHDIIAGTAIKEEYDIVERELQEVIGEARGIIEGLLGDVGGLIVFNDMPWARSEVIEFKGSPGYRVPCQKVGDSTYVLLEGIPPLGFKVYDEEGECYEVNGGVYVDVTGWGVTLGNEVLEVTIGSDGLIRSLKSRDGFEYLGGPSGVLRVHVDEPALWDAWDVEREALEYWDKVRLVDGPEVVVRGPLLSCTKLNFKWGSSNIIEFICVKARSPTVDFKLIVDWRDKNTLLKTWFKPSVEAERVAFEAPFGVVYRGVGELSTTKFEAPALRWVDVSNGSRGLAVISTSRHGYSYIGGWIGLSLLKKPIFPNPWTDEGPVEITYHLYPHRGDYVEGEVYKQALSIWSPLKVIAGKGKRRVALREYTIAWIEPEYVIPSAIKRAEDGDGYIMRIYNPTDKDVEAKIVLSRRLAEKTRRVVETNVVEDEEVGELRVKDGVIRLRLGPYKVKTLKITLS